MSATTSGIVREFETDAMVQTIANHFRALFEEGDTICLTLIHATDKTPTGAAVADNSCLRREVVVTPDTIAELLSFNDQGYNVYAACNPLKSGATKRIKYFAGEPRTVFCEVDENGPGVLAAIRAAVAVGTIPEPTVIMESSPNKFQFIWRINPAHFTLERVEAVNKALVLRFGADPASTDYLRVFRIPCLRNLKYPERPTVEIVSTNPDGRYNFEDFKIPIGDVNAAIVKPPANENDLYEIAGYFEAAATETNVRYSPLKQWADNGYLWEITCPWVHEHTGQKDSGTIVILHTSGALDFVCQHAHCKDRTWTSDMRPWMEGIVGHALRFKDRAPGACGIVRHNYEIQALTPAEESAVIPETAPEVPAPVKADAIAMDASTMGELYQTLLAERKEIEAQIAEDDIQKTKVGDGETLFSLENNEWSVAQLAFKLFGTHLRFVVFPGNPDGEWRTFDGKSWSETASSIYLKSVVVKTSEYIEKVLVPPEKDNKVRLKHLMNMAAKCKSDRFATGVIKYMKRAALVNHGIFDQKPWLFNFNNGTFDLLENKFYKFRREDYLTIRTSVNYEPTAEGQCPVWYEFLENCFDDAAVREYIVRWLGVSCFGYPIKEMLLGYGKTDNGKTVILELLRRLCGSYCRRCDFSTLTVGLGQSAGGARSDLAALEGARCATFDESEQKTELSEGKLKELCSGDGSISARDLYKSSKEFKVALKILLFTNFRPLFSNDEAVWERLNIVHFANSYKRGHPKRINDLAIKLRREKSAIMLEFLKGARQWLLVGDLAAPAAVKATKDAYQRDLDFVEGFLAKCCDRDVEYCSDRPTDKSYTVEVRELYNFYLQWSRLEGNEVLTERVFNVRLADKGIKPDNHHGPRRKWRGVQINELSFKTIQSDGGSTGDAPTDPEQIPF